MRRGRQEAGSAGSDAPSDGGELQRVQRELEEVRSRYADLDGESRRTHQELEQSRTELRVLTSRLLTAQEEERRRLAADLHDDISQQLAALQVEIETLQQQFKRSPRLAARVRHIRIHLRKVCEHVQQLARRLHPAIVEDLGLAVALRAHAEEFGRRERIRVVFRQRRVPAVIPRALALCLYRVAQEALRNAARHAGTKRVVITLETNRNGIGLCVADYGRGFDPAAIRRDGRTLGLVTMEERVRAVGGTFRIRSRRGDGTHVHAWIPLPTETA